MSVWLLVRHGESAANAEGWLAGHLDVDLTAKGVAQAEALRPLLGALAPDRVFSSDLLRARRTAEIALHGRDLSLQLSASLRERTLGEWEGARRAILRSSGDMAHLLSWRGRPPGGESQEDLARRALTWLAARETPGLHLVFAHAGLIRVLSGLVQGVPREQIGVQVVDNTELVELEVPVGRWKELLIGLDDASES